jgi:hypothetical protein
MHYFYLILLSMNHTMHKVYSCQDIFFWKLWSIIIPNPNVNSGSLSWYNRFKRSRSYINPKIYRPPKIYSVLILGVPRQACCKHVLFTVWCSWAANFMSNVHFQSCSLHQLENFTQSSTGFCFQENVITSDIGLCGHDVHWDGGRW